MWVVQIIVCIRVGVTGQSWWILPDVIKFIQKLMIQIAIFHFQQIKLFIVKIAALKVAIQQIITEIWIV